ncbi:DUF58 domain-containing protein [Methylocystis echinoides]|uniref:DUF58 domain-containing protein n=1 Tax=Methylocystis echinoides TaxID=29468 RepID=A0A9W6LSZ9_9HYPH|nr:DUF58 domain-containing protein [Methylocystis echinoides]GLI94118.1 hypothetical protein LMG27198_31100 [Methylocystis echinoides]
MIEPAVRPGVDLDVEALIRLRRLLTRSAARQICTAPPSGGIPRRRRGRGIETYDVRSWSDGDDIRFLDRNVTARTGAPHVRTFHEERERNVLYLVDLRPSMLFGTRRAFRSVAAAEAIVACAWRTLDAYGRAGLAVATASGPQFLGWAANGGAFASLLDKLAAAHRTALDKIDDPEPPLAEALEEMERAAGAAAMTVATALDAPGECFDAVAGGVARRRNLDVLLIADRFEIAPPPGAYPYRTREGDAGRLRIARAHETRAEDNRATRLRLIGARVLQIDAGLEAAATARALERFDARGF